MIPRSLVAVLISLTCLFLKTSLAAEDSPMKVGFAQQDITPQVKTPMWG